MLPALIRFKRYLFLTLALAPLALVASPAQATPPPLPSGAELAESANLALRGAGDLDKWWFDVFEASLWTPGGQAWSLEYPFALVLRYNRDFSRQDIIDSTLENLRRLGRGSEAQRKQWAEALHDMLVDVSAGDRVTALFIPGEGTYFYFNDRRTGRIDDPAFGPAFFAIWLSPETAEPGLRKALLAASSPESG